VKGITAQEGTSLSHCGCKVCGTCTDDHLNSTE